ncbi:MAG: NTP transferase domain-containing protein [Oceanobacter sp.]
MTDANKAPCKVLGLVLAGGESRRMGRDKALLPFKGFSSLLHRQVKLMQQLPLFELVVSRHERLQTPTDLGVPILSDHNDQQHDGPLAGLHSAAFAYPEADALLVLPVDLPLMDSSSMDRLLTEGIKRQVPLYFEDEYLPLYLPLTETIREYLADQLSMMASDRSIRGLLRANQAQTLIPKNQRALTNANTEAEWQATQTHE